MTHDEAQARPLQCECDGNAITITIGIDTLRFAAERHPDFWDGDYAPTMPNIRVTDACMFAKEVVRALNDESEDGSTLVTRMMDAAMSQAVLNGCEGVDHPEEQL